MHEVIESIIKDELKAIRNNEHRRGGGKLPYDIDHYQGVIDGQKKAYKKLLDKIKAERRKVGQQITIIAGGQHGSGETY